MPRSASQRRSVVKALTYRVLIMCRDFGARRDALGFMIVSNIYTTIAHFLHDPAAPRRQARAAVHPGRARGDQGQGALAAT
jgi:hypothetical protein